MSWKVRLKSSNTEQNITGFPTEQAARDWVYKSVAVGDGYQVEVLDERAAELAPPRRMSWDELAAELGENLFAPGDEPEDRAKRAAEYRAAEDADFYREIQDPNVRIADVMHPEVVRALLAPLRDPRRVMIKSARGEVYFIPLRDPPPPVRANRPHKAQCRHGAPWWRDDCLLCGNERFHPGAVLVLCGRCGAMRQIGNACFCELGRY